VKYMLRHVLKKKANKNHKDNASKNNVASSVAKHTKFTSTNLFPMQE
jgi:hypothetical protein